MPTVLITGCDEGLGRGFAEAYAGDGWDVVATYRDIANRWGEDGAIRHLPLDVTRPSDFAALKERIGAAPIDVLISNAAIAIDPMRLGAIDYEFAARILDVNTIGPLRLVEAFVDNVAASPHGKIALITSRMGSIGDNTSGGMYGYRMSKAALNAAGASLARDLAGQGIAVAILHPGAVRTAMTGGRGQVSATDSVRGLLACIDELSLETTGQFRHANGEELPW